jgi:hypothetical protein
MVHRTTIPPVSQISYEYAKVFITNQICFGCPYRKVFVIIQLSSEAMGLTEELLSHDSSGYAIWKVEDQNDEFIVYSSSGTSKKA